MLRAKSRCGVVIMYIWNLGNACWLWVAIGCPPMFSRLAAMKSWHVLVNGSNVLSRPSLSAFLAALMKAVGMGRGKMALGWRG